MVVAESRAIWVSEPGTVTLQPWHWARWSAASLPGDGIGLEYDIGEADSRISWRRCDRVAFISRLWLNIREYSFSRRSSSSKAAKTFAYCALLRSQPSVAGVMYRLVSSSFFRRILTESARLGDTARGIFLGGLGGDRG